jgi:anion-transporting  ArsA/GET3 family ATPase
MARRLRIVMGKGGVGRTTIATALALAEVEAGKRVLLCEVRGHDRVAALLQTPKAGAHLREVMERLSVVDMNPDDAIHEYALLVLRFERVYRAVFENRLVRSFLRLIPSLGELVMLGKIWYHEQQVEHGRPRFDVIVVDAPATGHGLALLRTPQSIEATVPAGPLREHARNIRALLSDPAKTVLHIVTTPEEMPVNEAVDIWRAARGDLGIPLGEAFINQCAEAVPREALASLASSGGSELAGLASALEQREVKRLAGEQHLARLPAPLLASAVRLPLRVGSSFGLTDVRLLAERLTQVVAA